MRKPGTAAVRMYHVITVRYLQRNKLDGGFFTPPFLERIVGLIRHFIPSLRGSPMFGWILLGILVLLILFGIGMSNGLVRLKVQCDNAWAAIDVQLKRRYDLIPNLVETVKGYAQSEEHTSELQSQFHL